MLEKTSMSTEFETTDFWKYVYIIGLGWLGLPLARQLNLLGIITNGTVRSKKKQSQLKLMQINADIMQLDKDYPNYSCAFKHLANVPEKVRYKCVVLNIPPGRANFNAVLFVKHMFKLIDDLFELNIDRIIFISTTSVFGHCNGDITLDSKVSPITESAIAHVEIERYLLNNFAEQTLVLRPSGLIGTNIDGSYRHPIYSILKKQAISEGEKRVNLIHQKDLINCIQRAIENDITNTALNLSSLEHPTRKEYYTWCAKKLGLKAPNFLPNDNEEGHGKVILGKESLSRLGDLQLLYPSPYDMI